MSELINGKTPEEIKQELQWLAHGCPETEPECDECIHAEICNRSTEGDTPCNALALIERIEAKVPKWISVEERLPEKLREADGTLVNYLIYMPEYGVDVGNYFEPAKTWVCMGIPCKVTHWMLLPEPPEVSE